MDDETLEQPEYYKKTLMTYIVDDFVHYESGPNGTWQMDLWGMHFEIRPLSDKKYEDIRPKEIVAKPIGSEEEPVRIAYCSWNFAMRSGFIEGLDRKYRHCSMTQFGRADSCTLGTIVSDFLCEMQSTVENDGYYGKLEFRWGDCRYTEPDEEDESKVYTPTGATILGW